MGRGGRSGKEIRTNHSLSQKTDTPKEENPHRHRWLKAFRDSEDRGAERKEKGLDNYQGLEMIRTEDLLELREYDRELPLEPGGYYSDLYKSIQKNGVGDAVVISYNPKTRVAYVAEGNHRIKIAYALGISEIPARVNISTSEPNSEDPTCLGGLYITGDINTNKELVTPTELLKSRYQR